MKRFTKAMVKTPCERMINGITTAGLGRPNYELALQQHGSYIHALERSGLEVIVLDQDEQFPDSVFIEDTCLMTPACAIITNPGALSRKGEVQKVDEAVKNLGLDMEYIKAPGTLDAGDVMMVGNHYYVGLSERTNIQGAGQLNHILKNNGSSSSAITIEAVLHLKTGMSYLEENNLLATGEFLRRPEFKKFRILEVGLDETYAANSVWINGVVLVPEGYPRTKKTISDAGYRIIEVDVSEFRKLDGGLSCLSLRF